jgi:hypothetical protein
MVKMLSKSGLPCFKAGPERTVKGLEKRLALNMTEVQVSGDSEERREALGFVSPWVGGERRRTCLFLCDLFLAPLSSQAVPSPPSLPRCLSLSRAALLRSCATDGADGPFSHLREPGRMAHTAVRLLPARHERDPVITRTINHNQPRDCPSNKGHTELPRKHHLSLWNPCSCAMGHCWRHLTHSLFISRPPFTHPSRPDPRNSVPPVHHPLPPLHFARKHSM